MAAFASFAAAEARAYAKRADKTWVNAFAERSMGGTLGLRVQRFMAPTTAATRQQGGWEFVGDDTQV